MGKVLGDVTKNLPTEKYIEERHYLIFQVVVQVTSAPTATDHKQTPQVGWKSSAGRINRALAQDMQTTTRGQTILTDPEQHPSPFSLPGKSKCLLPTEKQAPSISSSQNASQSLGSKSCFCTLRTQFGTVRWTLLAGTCIILVFSSSLFFSPPSPPHLPHTPNTSL